MYVSALECGTKLTWYTVALDGGPGGLAWEKIFIMRFRRSRFLHIQCLEVNNNMLRILIFVTILTKDGS
jgi:hypothetical protein